MSGWVLGWDDGVGLASVSESWRQRQHARGVLCARAHPRIGVIFSWQWRRRLTCLGLSRPDLHSGGREGGVCVQRSWAWLTFAAHHTHSHGWKNAGHRLVGQGAHYRRDGVGLGAKNPQATCVRGRSGRGGQVTACVASWIYIARFEKAWGVLWSGYRGIRCCCVQQKKETWHEID